MNLKQVVEKMLADNLSDYEARIDDLVMPSSLVVIHSQMIVEEHNLCVYITVYSSGRVEIYGSHSLPPTPTAPTAPAPDDEPDEQDDDDEEDGTPYFDEGTGFWYYPDEDDDSDEQDDDEQDPDEKSHIVVLKEVDREELKEEIRGQLGINLNRGMLHRFFSDLGSE